MNRSKKIYESDDQGLVHVDVAVGRARQQVEVVVVWGEVEPESRGELLDDLLGILAGVDLERPPQGEYERRDPLS